MDTAYQTSKYCERFPMSSVDIIDRAKSEGRTILSEVESKHILEEAGIPTARAELAATREKAVAAARDMGFPVVLKIVSPQISHKSDIGGVRLNLASEEEVAAAFDEIVEAARRAEQLDPKDIGPHLLSGVMGQVAGENEAAVRENRKAADKLSAWARRDPAQRQYVAWGMGMQAITAETPWWGDAERTAQRVREALDLHSALLRVSPEWQKTQDGVGPR